MNTPIDMADFYDIAQIWNDKDSTKEELREIIETLLQKLGFEVDAEK